MFERRPHHRPTPPTPELDDRADHGFSLVEVIVSVALLGLIAASILPAVWTMVSMSASTSVQSTVASTLGRARDLVTAGGYIPCPETDGLGGYESRAAGAASLVGWSTETVQVDGYQYFDNRSRRWGRTNPAAAGDCQVQSAIHGTATLQRFTIRVTAPDGTYTDSLEVIVGDLDGADV